MTRSVIREHIFKLLFRVEFHDAHELDGQIRLYMNELGTISEADCKYITEKTQTIAALLPEIDEKINSVSEGSSDLCKIEKRQRLRKGEKYAGRVYGNTDEFLH